MSGQTDDRCLWRTTHGSRRHQNAFYPLLILWHSLYRLGLRHGWQPIYGSWWPLTLSQRPRTDTRSLLPESLKYRFNSLHLILPQIIPCLVGGIPRTGSSLMRLGSVWLPSADEAILSLISKLLFSEVERVVGADVVVASSGMVAASNV